jgi:hypothetical protein
LNLSLSVVLKFLLLFGLTYLVSNLLVSLYRLLSQRVKTGRSRNMRQVADAR